MSTLAAIDLALAQRFGDGDRAAAAAIALASWAVRAGHTGVPLQQLDCGELRDLLGQSNSAAPTAAEMIDAIGDHPNIGPPETGRPFVLDRGMLYLRRLWQLEQEAADRLRELAERRFGPLPADTGGLLDPLIADTEGNRAARRALLQSASSGLTLLCGGPGTGKTWTAARLLAFLQRVATRPLRIAAAAPTGKAAARLGASLRSMQLAGDMPLADARTIHRLLGSRPFATEPRHTAARPLPCDVLLLDEASMVDLPMLVALLRALPAGARLVLLGDSDQLPALGGGRVLADLLQVQRDGDAHADPADAPLQRASDGVPPRADPVPPVSRVASRLQQPHRFAAHSSIARLLAAVAGGRADAALAALDGADPQLAADWTHCDPTAAPWPQRWRDGFAGLRAAQVSERLAALLQFRVLCAGNQGARGVHRLNAAIEQACLGRPRFGQVYDGQPILVLANAPQLDLWNGDLGVIAPGADADLRAWFADRDGSPRDFHIDSLPAFQTAYAMSVHKAQGSEFENVVLVLPATSSPLLSREWLYTGLSRGRQSVSLCGDVDALRIAIARQEQRWSKLPDRLLSR